MKTRKLILRIYAMLTALLMLCSVCAGCINAAAPVSAPVSTPAPAESPASAAEPETPPAPAAQENAEVFSAEAAKAGDKLEGFTVEAVGGLTDAGAKTITFAHDKTGAKVMFALNDDTDRAFCIGFHTEPDDDSGMLHILEHASCASSERYPDKDAFFSANNRTYITNINAGTYQNATIYHVSSTSDVQLLKLVDFYLDCCFNSSIRTVPEYIEREGWRYELASKDDPLTINGIVYNEMRGAYGDIKEISTLNVQRTLFPDTPQRFSSGGTPESIPTLSYDKLIDFYDKCYHPSNSFSIIYGDVDVQSYLKLMNDGFFSKYEKVEPSPYPECQPAFSNPIDSAEFYFPAAKDSSSSGSELALAYAVPADIADDAEKTLALDVITMLLSDPSSDLMQTLEASGIASDYQVMVDICVRQPIIYFRASDADESRRNEFRDIVYSGVRDVIENGFDEDMKKSIFASLDFDAALTRNNSYVGVNIVSRAAFALCTNMPELVDLFGVLDKVEENAANSYLEDILNLCVLENTHCAFCVTIPQPGLLESEQAKETERLAGIKAGMTDAELDALVAQTKSFNEWNNLPANEETVAKLQSVTSADIDTTLPFYPANSKQSGGWLYTSDVDMSGVSSTQLEFDLSGLTLDELRMLKLYCTLAGSATETKNVREVALAKALLLNSLNLDLDVTYLTREMTEYAPFIVLSFYAMDESYDTALDLALEIARTTSPKANVSKLAQNINAEMQEYSNVESVLFSVIAYQTLACDSARYGLNRALIGLDYYEFLKNAQKRLDEQPEAFLAEMAAVRDKAFTSDMYAFRAGSESSNPAAAKRFEKLKSELPAAKENQRCEFGDSARHTAWRHTAWRRTAFTGNTTSNYVYLASKLPALTNRQRAAFMVLEQLIYGEYLLPELRFKAGAYGAYITIMNDELLLLNSYRDSSFTNTLEVFSALPDFLYSLNIDDELLEDYKLSALSSVTLPYGKLNTAMANMFKYCVGWSDEELQSIANDVKAVNADDINALIPLLDELLANSVYAVATSAESAKANADLFSEITPLP